MARREPQSNPPEPQLQSTPQLVRSIASDTGTLVRKEIELAKQEITEALVARAKSALAFGVAGALGLLGLLFAALATAAALSIVFPMWLAALIIMGTLFLMAGLAELAYRGRLRERPGPDVGRRHRDSLGRPAPCRAPSAPADEPDARRSSLRPRVANPAGSLTEVVVHPHDPDRFGEILSPEG